MRVMYRLESAVSCRVYKWQEIGLLPTGREVNIPNLTDEGSRLKSHMQADERSQHLV